MFVYSLEHNTEQDTQDQVAPGMLYNGERIESMSNDK